MRKTSWPTGLKSPSLVTILSFLLLAFNLTGPMVAAAQLTQGDGALAWFAVSQQAMTKFESQCVSLPSINQASDAIKQIMLSRRSDLNAAWTRKFTDSVGFESSPHKLYTVSLDKMKLVNVPTYDLYVINELTQYQQAADPLYKAVYPKDITLNGGVLDITRHCLSAECASNARDLSRYTAETPCSDALCASQMLFGKSRGIYILLAYLEYGSNLSQFSYIGAEPNGFKLGTLRSILASFEVTPSQLRHVLIENKGFFRLRYLDTLDEVANAAGAVGDHIEDFDDAGKLYVFTHELGHRNSDLKNNLDSGTVWFKASGWTVGQNGLPKHDGTVDVSAYANSSPAEDFAETYTLYRFNPEKLKQISLTRYQFMKTNIFRGIEYTIDLCNGSIVKDNSVD